MKVTPLRLVAAVTTLILTLLVVSSGLLAQKKATPAAQPFAKITKKGEHLFAVKVAGQAAVQVPPSCLTAPFDLTGAWIDINCSGLRVDNNATNVYTPPMQHAVSSLIVRAPQWVAFFEDSNFSDGDDVLWVKGPCVMWNLLAVSRPHGTNNWNDVIRAVEIPNPPVPGPNTNQENRTDISCGN